MISGADRRRRAIGQRSAQVRHQLGAFEHDEAVVERVALVGFGKAAGDDAGNAFELQRRGGLFATRAGAEVESADDDVALLIERVEVRIVIFKCDRRHLLRRHVVAVSVFAGVNAVGVQIVFVDKENATAHAGRETVDDLAPKPPACGLLFGAPNRGAGGALG